MNYGSLTVFTASLATSQQLASLDEEVNLGDSMKRVTGMGGIFFKAKDAPSVAGTTGWSIGPQEDDRFAPSSAPFMVNYRLDDLYALVKVLTLTANLG